VAEESAPTSWSVRPIGVIRSPFAQPAGAPVQGALEPGHRGTVEVFDEFAEALDGVEGFSHLTLVYLFHRADGWAPKVHPFLDEAAHGLFATRAPRRPNPIGLSVVRLVGRRGCVLDVEDLDVVDGTPLLDIKPHVPEFDCRPGAVIGWLEGKLKRPERRRADDRFERD
jgi:tRNA-Thr(GGU) m(6)t(6)A37 methyltransferase TsaA